jgi:hypothetical protein
LAGGTLPETSLELIPAAGPVGTVKKPSVVCEALFKPLWESALFADFHRRRQFPQVFLSFFFARFFSFCVCSHLFSEKYRTRIA